MLALAAARLGLKTCIYNDTTDAPAFQVTHSHTAAPSMTIWHASAGFAEACDAVTFEFENVPAATVAHLAEPAAGAPGRARPWRITQDRLRRKRPSSNRWA